MDRKNPQQQAHDRAIRQAALDRLTAQEKAAVSGSDDSQASGGLPSGARNVPGSFGSTPLGSGFRFSR